MIKSRISKTPFIVGPQVPSEFFFGRQGQIEQFYSQCVLAPVLQPIRILGLRRSGKTSFLKYVSDVEVKKKFVKKAMVTLIKFAYVNAQTVHSREEFYDLIADAINEQLQVPAQTLPGFQTGRAFKKWLENALYTSKNIKVIVLIDEFEKLNDIEDFDVDFFDFLRALASAHQSSFTWVTASATDLYTLDKKQKTSPFWNIFHPTPIIMGGFEEQDAQSLIKDALLSVQKKATQHEISEIISLSGMLPYFIQAVADTWYSIKDKKINSPEIIKAMVFEMLSNPDNQMQHIYRGYWEDMDKNKRSILKDIAGGRRMLNATYPDLAILLSFGLIANDSSKYGGYKISGQILKQFVVDADYEISPFLAESTESSDLHGSSVVRIDTVIGGNFHTGKGDLIGHDNINIDLDKKRLVEFVYNEIEKKQQLATDEKTDLKQDVKELHGEFSKNEGIDESFVKRRLKNISKMAPDILDIILTTVASPTAGFSKVAMKIAEKIKSSPK
jgi:hypothetical protein